MNIVGRRRDTRELLLDAAETLFARDGYRGASLRGVTARAGVNLAAVNYHFGSKAALLDSLLERRIGPLQQRRSARLAEIRERAGRESRRVSPREVVEVIIATAPGSDTGGAVPDVFRALVGRSMADPDETVRRAVHRFMRPMFRSYLEVLAEALPGSSPAVLSVLLQATLGAVQLVRHARRDPRFVEGSPSGALDEAALNTLLTDYLTAGLGAPSAAGPGGTAGNESVRPVSKRETHSRRKS
jgi:AcrR family transcriptional regulator